jgi:hypothetical protein
MPIIEKFPPTHNAPRISAVLVEWLEACFPMRNPSLQATLAEVQRSAGQQDVLQLLREHLSATDGVIPSVIEDIK